MVTPTGKREAVAAMVEGTGISQRRACGLMSVSRTTVRYRPRRREGETELRATLKALAFAKPRYGYQRLWNELRRAGRVVNRKRVYRLYKLAPGPQEDPAEALFGPQNASCDATEARTNAGRWTSCTT